MGRQLDNDDGIYVTRLKITRHWQSPEKLLQWCNVIILDFSIKVGAQKHIFSIKNI